MNPLLKLEQVSVAKEGKNILENINLEINEGEVYTILGNNGAGKSSLVYALMGVGGYTINSGKILYHGKDITRTSSNERARNGISLAWQEPVRFKGITIRDYLSASSSTASEREHKLYMEAFGLNYQDYIDRLIDSSLSGGERKRVELVSVFLSKPKLILLDEPDSGIDYHGIIELKQNLVGLLPEHSSIILVTHQEEIARMGSRGSIICMGRLEGSGEINEICSKFKKCCSRCGHA